MAYYSSIVFDDHKMEVKEEETDVFGVVEIWVRYICPVSGLAYIAHRTTDKLYIDEVTYDLCEELLNEASVY